MSMNSTLDICSIDHLKQQKIKSNKFYFRLFYILPIEYIGLLFGSYMEIFRRIVLLS